MTFVPYQNVQIHYEYCGCQLPKAGNIVFLHGLGLSMREYDEWILYFSNQFNVLRYDVFGHGQSDLPNTPITVDLLATQLEFMTHEFVEGPFYIIAGPGMGYVASRFCRLYNPPVSGLVLMSPPPIYLSLDEKRQITDQIQSTTSNGFHLYKQFLLSNFTINQDLAVVAKLAKQLDQTTEQVHLGLINAWLDEDFVRDFRYLNTPIFVVAGTEDTLFPSSTYGTTASYMKAELMMIPAAAHLVALDNPRTSADAVLSFIASIESGTRTERGFNVRKEEVANALYRGLEQTEDGLNNTMGVYLLKTFRVQIGNTEITKGWNLRKVKSLFLYMIFHGTVRREELIEVFWPDISMHSARNQLRMNLHFLKSMLNVGGCEFLHTDRAYVTLQQEIDCDATDYIRRLKESYQQMLRGDLDVQTSMNILEIEPKRLLTHAYDEWYLGFRDEIETQYSALCQWTSDRLSDSNRQEEATRYQHMLEDLIG